MRLLLLTIVLTVGCANASTAQPQSKEPSATTFQKIETKPASITLQIEDKRKEGFSISPTDVIAGFALLISLASLYHANKLHKLNRKSSIHDDYWMRTVVYPNTISKLMNFIDHSPSEFRAAGNDAGKFWSDYGIDESNKIRDTFSFLSVIDANLPPKAEIIFDNMDDDILSVQNEQNLKDLQAKVSKQLIDLLRNAQERV